MASNGQESTGFGFLPPCPTPRSPEKPRGPSTGRPQKPRALEMDETLNMTGSLKGKMETGLQRQQKAAQKMKDNKTSVAQLKERAANMERELERARAEAEKNKVDAAVRSQYDKMQAEHAKLQATHSWTKSSLDSTLAAQEEYRKGYTSLQAAYKKAQADLEQTLKKVESAKDAGVEAAELTAAMPQKEKEFEQDLADAQDVLKNIITRQKKKSQAVLDKMLSGQTSSLMQLTLQNWQKAISDEKFWRDNAKSLEEAEKRLAEFQDKKKGEAKRVLDRMSAASDTSLGGLMLQYWSKFTQEAKKEREEAKKVEEAMKNGKIAARKTLEQNLMGSATGLMQTALTSWISYFRECKKVNELKAQTEAKMKEYQSKKKGEQSSVIERMAGEQTQTLLTRMFLSWSMTCLDESAARHAHNDLTNQVDDLEAQLKALQESLAQTTEDLEDTEEEVTESRRKNALLREELKNIMNLSQNMDSTMKEMDD